MDGAGNRQVLVKPHVYCYNIYMDILQSNMCLCLSSGSGHNVVHKIVVFNLWHGGTLPGHNLRQGMAEVEVKLRSS